MKKLFSFLTLLFLSTSMYAWWWGDDADYAYSTSNATYTKVNSTVRKIQASVSQVGYAGCLDYMTRMFFVVPAECDYVPTGVYNLLLDDGESPYQEGTVIAGQSTSVHQVSDWCNGGSPDYYADYFSSGSVIVFNPNKSSVPNFILASFTTLKGWERTVTIGTMPGTRTVIFNDDVDGNGNTFSEVVNPFCADEGCTTFYEGTEFILTPQPASGFVFNSWTGTGAGDITPNGDGTYTLIVGAKDYNISATWSQLSGGTITAIASPVAGGSVTVSPSGYQEGGTPVTLTPSNNPGYVFTGWDDNNDGVIDNTSNPRTVYVNDDHTYIAIFAVVRTITVSPDNASHGSTSGSGTYADGASVQISASGLNGYQFSEWDDGNSDNPRTITVSSSKTTYTASFILPGMTVGSCSDADISFHCNYGDIVVAQQSNYFAKYNQNSYCNNLQFVAKNSDNFGFELFFARNGDSYTTTYNGGECVSQLGPRAGNYVLWRAVRSNVSGYTYWRCYSGNTVVCYRNTSGYEPDLYSKIIDNNGNYIKLRSAEAGDGAITVSTNNVGGLFFETNEYVQNYDQNKSIYFTFGNRNEYTVSLGTGTMTLTSGITMSATNGSNSASIRLNNTTTGSKTLSDFNVANCHFTHNGNTISEISNMTGTLTESSGTYTLTVKIRDCQQNLYTVTMSAVAVTTYHLTWDANGGVLVDNAVYSYAVEGDYPGGEELPDGAPNATREGYQLTGWYDAVHDLTWTDDDWTMPNHDVTYVAQWTANTHNVSWVTDGNALTGTYTNGTTAYGTTIVAPATPTKNATAQYTYTFNGWTPAVAATMPDNDVTYTATWTETPVNYTLTWTTDGDALTGTYTSGTVAYGTAIAAPNTPTKTGYTFAGWDVTPASTMPAANTTYTATWDAVEYEITFHTNGGDPVMNLTYTIEYDINLWTAEDATRAGYTFDGWYDNVGLTGDPVTTIPAGSTGNKEFWAKWTENITTYSVQFHAGEHGKSVSATAGGADISSGANVDEGTSVTLTAEAKNFYRFKEWQNAAGGQVSTDNPYTVGSLSGDLNLTAVFERNQTIALVDDRNAGDGWYKDYSDLVEDLTAAGEKVTVRYERELNKGTWNVFSLPFNYVLMGSGHSFAGNVYELASTDYDYANDWLSLNFLPVTTILQANKPYLFYSSTGVNNSVFENVTMAELTTNYYTVTNTGAGGSIEFRNTTYRQQLEKNNSHILFITNNKLYYMGGNNVYMRAFRGFFYLNGFDLNTNVAPRVRIVLNGQTATELEVVSDMPKSGDGQVKKYIEKGTLVIEREGVRYDLTGAKIN